MSSTLNSALSQQSAPSSLRAESLDLSSVDRSAGRLRRVVRAASACWRFYCANSYGARLEPWPFIFWRCSPTIRISWPRFIARITRMTEFEKYRIFTVHVALLLGAGRSRHACLVSAASLDFHALHLLEPVALHGTKLRVADDVRAPRGRFAHVQPNGGRCSLSFIASFILLMLSFHTGASGDALILSLGLASEIHFPARAVLRFFLSEPVAGLWFRWRVAAAFARSFARLR